MDERRRFIARLLEGEKMSPLCREFGISRVTGYKKIVESGEWISIYKKHANGKWLIILEHY